MLGGRGDGLYEGGKHREDGELVAARRRLELIKDMRKRKRTRTRTRIR